MLKKSWPKEQGGVPCSPKAILKHVLTWKLWPGFFQRFGNGSFHVVESIWILQGTSYLKLYSANEIKPYRCGRVLTSQQTEHLNFRVFRLKHAELNFYRYLLLVVKFLLTAEVCLILRFNCQIATRLNYVYKKI